MMDPPSVEDRPIWDLWLSQYRLPVVLAADQLGLFEFLRDRPATIDDICHDLKLLRRSVDALTAALASTGFLVQHDGRFQLTPLSRTYLLPDSEFYWVPMLGAAGFGQLTTEVLLNNLRTENLGEDDRVTRRWEHGEMTAEDAAGSNQRMHSHSFPSALGLARSHDFADDHRLLDVAGAPGAMRLRSRSSTPLALHGRGPAAGRRECAHIHPALRLPGPRRHARLQHVRRRLAEPATTRC